jgi:hypothetical protein
VPNCFSLAVKPSVTVNELKILFAVPLPQGQGISELYSLIEKEIT